MYHIQPVTVLVLALVVRLSVKSSNQFKELSFHGGFNSREAPKRLVEKSIHSLAILFFESLATKAY